MPLSEWAEKNIVLPEGLCAVPGPFRAYPYQKALLDAIGDPDITRVTLVKAARIGFSISVACAIAHFCINDPAPVICLLPVESDAKDFMKSDLEPLFASSPALHGILRDDLVGQRGRSRSTMLSRFFPGGSLRVVASRSPRNLRAKTARVLFCDEVDAYELTAEGSAVELATKRTLTFADRKVVLGSTPLESDTSHVLRAYEESDARIFEVPCPECGAFHEIEWADISWPPGEPKLAKFQCPHCGSLVGEEHKPAMVTAGRWRITRAEIKGHAGFRLNALVSLLKNASWPILAAEFLAAKDDPSKLQPFINCSLAQGWRAAGEDIDDTALASRVEPFSLDAIPPEVLVMTCGVDCQDDRLECTLAGWSRVPGECFVLGTRSFTARLRAIPFGKTWTAC